MNTNLTNEGWNALVGKFETATEQPGRTGIGTTIALRRSILDMNKGTLADRMSCGSAKIRDLESGDRVPTLMETAGIALALGWTVNDLLAVACTLKGTALNTHSHSLTVLVKN